MKLVCRALLVMTVVLVSCNMLWADELPPYVKADWGASPDNVMFWEREPIYHEKSSQKPWQTQAVLYKRYMFGQPFLLIYSFDGDRLCAVDYYLDEEKAAKLSITDMKYLIADVDSRILPQLGTPHTAIIEKGLPVEDEKQDLWRYGKMASNERICMLVVAVVDEIGQTARFSVSFADAEHDAAGELKGVFDDIREDEAWKTASMNTHGVSGY